MSEFSENIPPTTAHIPAPFMYTQCPACKTVFRLRPDQLNAAQGQVRCSRCHTVFNALNNLFQQTSPDEANEQPAPPLKEASTVKAETATRRSRESSVPQRVAAEHSPQKDMAKRRGDHKASPPPEREGKRQAAAREPDRRLKDGISPSSSEQQPVVITQTAAQVSPDTAPGTAPDTAPGAAPLAIEQTLPLFEQNEAHTDTTIKTASQGKPPRKPQSGSPEKKSAEPPSPLFEFDAAINELSITADASDPSPAKPLSRKKKPRPAPSENEEHDLFTLSETQPSGEDNSLLFRYLPEENLTAELNPGDASTDEQRADSDANIQGKSNTHKTTQAQPGYTLPLEHEATRSGLQGAILWGIGITLMLVMLAVQYLYYHRMALAQEPRLRPLLTQMCRITACQLPPQRDLTEIELRKHLVQIHPRFTNSLLITATLVNSADFAQPFPIVEVVMTDLEQKQVARRRFLPNEYLIGSDGEGLLAPATEVPLMLEVLDPGKNAVGFEFNFY